MLTPRVWADIRGDSVHADRNCVLIDKHDTEVVQYHNLTEITGTLRGDSNRRLCDSLACAIAGHFDGSVAEQSSQSPQVSPRSEPEYDRAL